MTKQLSLSKRIIIEKMLAQEYFFASIVRKLNRSASTISREIQDYRCFFTRLLLEERTTVYDFTPVYETRSALTPVSMYAMAADVSSVPTASPTSRYVLLISLHIIPNILNLLIRATHAQRKSKNKANSTILITLHIVQ